MTSDRHDSFHSILFERDAGDVEAVEEPEFFGDLNLDQILTSLTSGREEYRLETFFYRPLHDVEAVHYRHHVLGDLQQEPVLGAVRGFADAMRHMRSNLALVEKLHHARQKQRWFLEAVATYCRAVAALRDQLDRLELRSRGFIGFRQYVATYDDSDEFGALAAETRAVMEALAAVSYKVHIRGNRVRVDRYDSEPDMSEQIEEAFAKFKQGAVKDYRVRIPDWPDMNHVEAQILDLVARLHPKTFMELEQFCTRNQRLSRRHDWPVRPRGPVLPCVPRIHCATRRRRSGVLTATRVSSV